MDKPLVSIIIPVYNSAAFIEETIQSAIQQTWPNKEIILVDDGSTDDSLVIIKQYESAAVKVFTQENKGAAAARNKGLAEAKGHYIQFLDADDLISNTKMEEQVNLLINYPDYIGLCSTVHFFDGDDPHKQPVLTEWYKDGSEDPIDFLIKLYSGGLIGPEYGGMIQPNAWLTPRQLIDKAGPWNETLSVDDDGEFFCRIVLASQGVKFSKNGLNYYRKFNHQQSLSAKKNKKNMDSAVTAIDLKYKYLKAVTTDPIVNTIFARHYWWTGVLAYPQFKQLSANCIKKARQYGYSGEKYVGGTSGHVIAKILGWKIARLMAWYRHEFKNEWI
ncbi:MAG: glycosyltransferase family 2 protein [Mucilaginibacter sp.]|nr:glycosyltransferase family 2 protein [Mucilaginibacter sp.]